MNKYLKKTIATTLTLALTIGICACDDGIHSMSESELRQEYYNTGYSPRQINALVYESNVLWKKQKKCKTKKVDFTKSSPLIDTVEENGEIKSFKLKLFNGDLIPFEAKGLTKNADGSLTIAPGGAIYSLKEIDGFMGMENVIASSEGMGELGITSGTSPSGLKEVSSHDELVYTQGSFVWPEEQTEFSLSCNSGFGYFKIETTEQYQATTIYSMTLMADGNHYGISKVSLYTDFYGWLVEGGYYDTSREEYNPDEGVYDFYLRMESEITEGLPDVCGCEVYGVTNYTIGDLHDKDGNVKQKTEPLVMGDYLDVEVLGATYKVGLPIKSPTYPMNYYLASETDVIPSEGDLNVLVIPVYFEEQKDNLSTNIEEIYDILGNVVTSDNSSINRESKDGYFTLSDYYNQVSNGKLNITSYVTDWYKVDIDASYEEKFNYDLYGDREVLLQSWVNENYKNWTDKLDSDSNGIYDAVIVVAASSGPMREGYTTISLGGAYNRVRAYGDFYKKDGQTAINRYVCISEDMFYQNFTIKDSGLTSNVLCHEFAHGLGLIDYYDVYYSGYNAVGNFDMQSNNEGDWNSYSKLAVGWTSPTVLTKDKIGSKIEVTVSNGEAIIIPTEKTKINSDGTISPFNEYIMVDLFSPDGVNKYDAPKHGLTDTAVRMYHVDSRLIKIDLKDDWEYDGSTYDVVNTNAYSEDGKYHIHLLQSGGKNTFTKGEYSDLQNSDFFHTGDKFRITDYKESFAGGKMNDGSDFPYEITVVSIDGNKATIEVKPVS